MARLLRRHRERRGSESFVRSGKKAKRKWGFSALRASSFDKKRRGSARRATRCILSEEVVRVLPHAPLVVRLGSTQRRGGEREWGVAVVTREMRGTRSARQRA